jgi:acyl carrier protein
MDAESDAQARDVVAFVVRQVGCNPERVTPQSRILEDLGVDGTDAADLMDEFGKKFGVDLATFQFSRHFGPEVIPLSAGAKFLAFICAAALSTVYLPWTAVLWVVAAAAVIAFQIRWQRADKPGSLRVSHLITAARVGRWVPPHEHR